VQAATAEIRLRRPQMAPELYEAALALDPSCRPAVRALFEIELERGNSARAAALLEVDAEATPAGPERVRRFEGLGDLALQLGDQERTARAFRRAVESLPTIKEAQRPLIEKLLAAERTAGNQAGVARAIAFLAATADPIDRAGLLCEAAEMFARADDPVSARAAAEEALSLDPYGEDAVELATELQVAAGDWEEVCSVLGRVLFRWEKLDVVGADPAFAYTPLAPGDEGRRTRRAGLWTRLGDGRRARGDQAGAATAYQRAVAVSPGAASVSARRGLVDLLEGQPEHRELVREQLAALLGLDPHPRDLLRYARTERAGRIARDHSEDAEIEVDFGEDPAEVDARRTHLELSEALGAELSAEDRRFLAEHAAAPLAAEQAYPGALRDADRALLVADPDDEPLGPILAALAPSAALLWPSATAAIEELGAGRVRGAPALAGGAAALLARVARALAAPDTVAFATSAPEAPEVSVICSFPPAVVFGPRLTGDEPPSVAEMRFLLGRAAELAQPARLPAAGLPAARFGLLVAGLVRAFGSARAMPPGLAFSDRELDDEAARLRRHLPLPLRGRLGQELRHLTGAALDPGRYRAACERAADRAGLLAAGDIAAAMRLVGARGDTRHLVGFAAGAAYIEARGRLGLHGGAR
jgi:tetratricopeptide (TPR) repeat protein